MRIGLLTQYYPPEIGAPQARLSALVHSLKERGHEAFVLTGQPNYPTGRLYPGYRGFFARDVIDEVPILRSWIFPTRSASGLRRLASYLSFSLSALISGTLRLPRVDYLITESPPLFLAPVGYLLAKLKGARWILNVSDLWPEVWEKLGLGVPRPFIRAAQAIERFCYRRAWLVTGQTRGILEGVSKSSPKTYTRYFPNGVDTSLFSATPVPSSGSRSREDRRCTFAYAGLHGVAQGLDQLLAAVARLGDLDIEVVFVGDGPEKGALMERAQRLALRSVRFLDPIEHREVPGLLANADVALVPLRLALEEAVPSKLYEAMAAGLPVLLVSVGEAERLLTEARAGLTVAPGDTHALADAMRFLAANPDVRREMGERGRAFVTARFDRQRINDEFVTFLESRSHIGDERHG
jgi:glycosyltransferase involved in cell wall biosynthesis